MALGTKNLGLIKAIHVGVNPPLNTKILWYNDATLPYTTGPAKVHYYYDVILADWYPLVGVGDGTGTFTYIAFANNCEGTENFSFELDPENHCYWAILTSPTEILPVNLLPELFDNMWTQFCRCAMPGQDGEHSYTYIVFADDCEGTNLSLDPMYEVDCEDCVYVDSWLNKQGSSAFAFTPSLGGIEVNLTNAVAGNFMTLDMKLNSLPLNDLIDYCLDITAPIGFVGELEIHIGDEPNKLILNGPTTEWKNTLVSQGSKIHIKVPDTFVGTMTATFTVKVGTEECCSEQIGDKCYCCHDYWATITTSTPIAPEDLLPALFENRWIKIGGCECDCDIDGQYNILSQQIEQLNIQLQDYMQINNNRVSDLENIVQNLQTQLNDCCTNLTAQINALTELFNQHVNDNNEDFGGIDVKFEEDRLRIGRNENTLTTEGLAPLVQPTIDSSQSQYSREIESRFNQVGIDIELSTQASKDYTDSIVVPIGDTQDSQGLTIVSNTEELANHEVRITALEV